MSRYYLTQDQTREIISASAYGDATYKRLAQEYVAAFFGGSDKPKPYARVKGNPPKAALCVESAIKPDIEICRLMPTFAIEYLSQHGVQPNTQPDREERQ